jgi:1,2-dihydroxy-3-keto-5-methylthiopentene dioxygenase
MSVLTVHPDDQPQQAEVFSGFDSIARRLQGIGVQFERWRADRELLADADQAAVVTAYRDSIDRLMQAYGFQSVDVISVRPDHPDKVALRNKFLAEHIHDDFEVRFFVDGQGLFYLHPDDKVYLVLCEQGDLISVPAHTRHWFDMGENPNLKAIRLFTTPEGWWRTSPGAILQQGFPSWSSF